MYKNTSSKEIVIKLILLLLISIGSLAIFALFAASPDTKTEVDLLVLKKHSDYSSKGADTCLKCHDEDSEFPVLDIFKTPHAVKTDKRTPFGQQQCESCHGPAGEHDKSRLRKGEIRESMISFDNKSLLPVDQRNKICSSCHQKIEKSHWEGSVHQVGEVACNDCHTIHTTKDPMRSEITQLDTCGNCHQSHKLASNRYSTHPIKFGQMGCTSCHSLHESDNENLLKRETSNEVCFDCHAEKRGPFLWEHEPVSEDCSLCHAPHGSNQPAMLTQRAPFLCQSCHSSQGHPSIANDDSGLIERRFPALRTGSAFLLGKACVNCHTKVHGSNHPSGSKLQR